MDANGPASSRYDRIVMTTVDIEATNAFALDSGLDGMFSGGLRYARYREEEAASTGYPDVTASCGLVAGLELSRSITDNVSLFGRDSTSIMFSNAVVENGGTPTNPVFNINEVEAGVEVSNSSGSMYGRLSVTAQVWNGVSDDDSENTGMASAGLEFGMRF